MLEIRHSSNGVISSSIMRKYLTLCVLIASLGGCASEGPTNQYFSMAPQKELFSAAHWKILAAQTAVELRQTLPQGRPTVWLQQGDDSQFSSGFEDLLATELVSRGILVSRDPTNDSRVVKVKIEVIHHRSGPPADPLKYTFLGTVAGLGIWFESSEIHEVPASAIAPLGLVGGAIVDAKRDFMPHATSTEIIISTAIFEKGYQTAGKSDVFYIQTPNSGEYMPPPPAYVPPPPPGRVIHVIGS